MDGVHNFLVYLGEAVLGRDASAADVADRVQVWAAALYSRTVVADPMLDSLLHPDTLKLIQLFAVPLQKARLVVLGKLFCVVIFFRSCIAALWKAAAALSLRRGRKSFRRI